MTRPDAAGGDRSDADRSLRRASRRGVLAVGAALGLAGCLVTSEGGAGPSRQTDDGAGNGSDANGGSGSESGGSSGGSGDESGDDGGGGDDGSDGGDATPDEVGPDGAGLVVTDTRVRSVTESGGWTRVRARLTVENAGRFDYGTIEFRVDAYATPAGTDEREAVGSAYVSRRFSDDDPFDGSDPRTFDVTIRFESNRTPVRPDPDRYAVDAAVRGAEPL